MKFPKSLPNIVLRWNVLTFFSVKFEAQIFTSLGVPSDGEIDYLANNWDAANYLILFSDEIFCSLVSRWKFKHYEMSALDCSTLSPLLRRLIIWPLQLPLRDKLSTHVLAHRGQHIRTCTCTRYKKIRSNKSLCICIKNHLELILLETI